MKRATMIALLLFLPLGSSAHQEDVPIENASELRDWCEEESRALFIGKGVTPYNWSASYWDEGNILRVKGSWRVGRKDAVVECHIARGALSRYATMRVDEPDQP